MKRLATVLAAAALLVPVAPVAAGAATCSPTISGPSDPDYAPAERAPNDPSLTFNNEQWYLYDCLPQSAPLAEDPTGAAGMSVNRAWKDFGYGSDSVLVAYMEGGVNWRRPTTAPELRRRAWLNTGELPKPEHADGTAASSYDLDGNGVVDVDDYKDDPRVKRPFLHASTAGGITTEDLIVAFSDHRDGDGNGYVDDISGWNFHRDTNDPQTDQSIYNHANGEQSAAVGEKDNGVGGAGMCPRCRLLSVKIGDEAIDRTDRTAEGIVFAVDSGAKVIIGVSVTLGESEPLRRAFRYAYDKGAVVAWASNDFESADHTEGMTFDHMWPGNGIVSDQTNRLDQPGPNDRLARTFRSRSSVTSYGPHALFSVGTKDGSTSNSTPIQGGVAAMVFSAGVDAMRSGVLSTGLDADEVKQVVRATVSDVADTPPSTFGQPFPAKPGFDIQYGYGRPDVHAAMAAVLKGDIPPTADLRSPRWYAAYDPTRQRAVHVEAGVAARRSSSYTWQLQYGLGPQPDTFSTFASGRGTTPRAVTGDLDLSRIPASFWRSAYATTADRLSIEQYDVTLRLQVVDGKGRLGEDRKVVQVRHDDSELAGFPKTLGPGLEPQPALYDVDGDGRLEIVQATSDGVVHVLRRDGSELPGFPVRTRTAPGFDGSNGVTYAGAGGWRTLPRPGDGVSHPPAVADLDHDGGVDIVVASNNGRVYAWDAYGHLRAGFPVQTSRAYARQVVPVPDTPYTRGRTAGAFGAPVLADLDGDGRLDIVLGGWDGKVYAWRADGRLLPGWPAETNNPDRTVPPGFVYARDYKVATTPTIADIDGDGHPDVVVALQDTSFPSGNSSGPVTGYVTAFTSKGTLIPGYPTRVPAVVQGYGTAQDFITEGVQTPVVYDSPAGPELVLNAGLAPAELLDLKTRVVKPMVPPVFAPEPPLQQATPMVHFTTSAALGKLVPGSPLPQSVQAGSAAADVATAVVATPGLGIKVRAGLTAYDPSLGAALPAFSTPRPLQGLPFLNAPAIADVSGDGVPDVISGGDSGAVEAYDGTTGAVVPGFPKWSGGWTLWSPSVGDLDGDGKVELVASTREGYLHVWRTPGRSTANTESWHYHQDERHTGHYATDTRPPAGVRGLQLRSGTASWTATGDDWNAGTPASYQLLASATPITQATVRAARVVATVAGTATSAHVPQARYYAVRAVDDAGNIGPLALRAPGAGGIASAPRTGRLPATGLSPLLPTLALVLLLTAQRLRRPRRARR